MHSSCRPWDVYTWREVLAKFQIRLIRRFLARSLSAYAHAGGAGDAPFQFCPSVDCYASAPTPAPTGSSAGMWCDPDGDECGQGLECVCAARRLRHLLFGYFLGVCTCQ